MSIRIFTVLSATTLLVTLTSLPSVAHAAALDKCGGVFVDGSFSCEFKPKKECQTTCETVAVEQSCAASLYTSCNSSCTSTSSTECTKTCSDSCTTSCKTDSSQSSRDYCVNDCSADCDTKCADSDHPERRATSGSRQSEPG